MNGSHHQRLLSITLDLRAACCPQLAPAAARRAIAQCASTVSRVDSILSAVLENGMHRNYDSDYYCNTSYVTYLICIDTMYELVL